MRQQQYDESKTTTSELTGETALLGFLLILVMPSTWTCAVLQSSLAV